MSVSSNSYLLLDIFQLLILELTEVVQGGRFDPQLVLGVEGEIFTGDLLWVNVVASSQNGQLRQDQIILHFYPKIRELLSDRVTNSHDILL